MIKIWCIFVKLFNFFVVVSATAGAAMAASDWLRVYGGAGNDGPPLTSRFIQTADGGFLVGTSTTSFGQGDADVWLLKLNAQGNVQWQRTYGTADIEYLRAIRETSNGGFVIAGFKWDSVSETNGWILRVDSSGNVISEQLIGGPNDEELISIATTADGGVVIAGQTGTAAFDDIDTWVAKINPGGGIDWQKRYDVGAAFFDIPFDIFEVPSGGFSLGGLAFLQGTGRAAFALRLDSSGNVLWTKLLDNPQPSRENCSPFPTNDGGFLCAGSTGTLGSGNDLDIWLVKMDASGNIQWQKTYGGTGEERPQNVYLVSDGSFLITGFTASIGAGGFDLWILKINASGDVLFQKTYGGPAEDRGQAGLLMADGSVVVLGTTRSVGAGATDLVVFKGSTGGTVANNCFASTNSSINAVTSSVPDTTPLVSGVSTTFVISLPSPAVAANSNAQIGCTLAVAPGSLSVSNTTTIEKDSVSGVATFQIKLAGPSSDIVTASYSTADGTAISGIDYEPVSGEVIFEPGTVIQNVQVNVNGDNSKESKEKFSLIVSDVSGAEVSRPVGTATIIDDDR